MLDYRFSLVTALLCACTGAGNAQTAVRDSAGLHIVTTGARDVPLNRSYSLLHTVGGDDAGATSFFFLRSNLIRSDTKGRIFVLDVDNNRVVVIDTAGKVLRTVGRKGPGPDEFDFPIGVVARRDSGFAVFDFAKGGLANFSAAGTVLGVDRISGPTPEDRVDVMQSGIVYTRHVPSAKRDSIRLDLVSQAAGKNVTIASVSTPIAEFLRLDGCPTSQRFPRFFEATLHWAVRDDLVATSIGPDYAVTIHSAGKSTTIIRRLIGPRPATATLAERSLGDSLRTTVAGGACTISAAAAVSKIGVAPTIPAIASIAIAPDGTLWIERTAFGSEPRFIDLFAGDGTYRGTLPANTPMPAAFIPGGGFAAIVKDKASGVDRLGIYGLNRP